MTERLHFHFSLSHSSVLAWRIPGTVVPGGLPSMGSHRVGHDSTDLAAAVAAAVCAFISFSSKMYLVNANANVYACVCFTF